MSEEVKPQAEATPPSTEQAPPKETTLDEVYTKYNVEETAGDFKAQPQQQNRQEPQKQQQDQEPLAVPDPTLDPQGHKAFVTRQQQDYAALRQALRGVAGEVQKDRIARAKAEEEADIKRAVDQVNQHLGDSKLDPDVVEISLGAEARRDPRFLALWKNRDKNPKAYQEGIKAFSTKLAKKFSMRTDPQIAENHRALKEATSTKATTAPEETETERLGKLTGPAFDKALDKFRASY